MRALYTGIALVIATASPAQLVNGSFEDLSGQGDLTGWVHSCLAQSAADGAPGSGNWSAEVEASNPQGCLPAMLYQVVPSAYDGMPFDLGGWCRNASEPWEPLIGFDIGVMAVGGGITPLNIGPTVSSGAWTWLYLEDTIHLQPGEQAVVICASGFVGGPAFALSRFDGIQFFQTLPFAIQDRPALSHLYDAANGFLHIACTNARITGVRLMDPLGRTLPVRIEVMGPAAVQADISRLPIGVYLATVRTDTGEKTLRFAVH